MLYVILPVLDLLSTTSLLSHPYEGQVLLFMGKLIFGCVSVGTNVYAVVQLSLFPCPPRKSRAGCRAFYWVGVKTCCLLLSNKRGVHPRLVTIVIAQWWCVHIRACWGVWTLTREGKRCSGIAVVGICGTGGKGPNFYQEVVMMLFKRQTWFCFAMHRGSNSSDNVIRVSTVVPTLCVVGVELLDT